MRWTIDTIRERAQMVREAAELEDKLATVIRLMHAVTLEDIADEWDRPAHWLNWGNKWQCSECKETQEYKSNFCPNCGRRME